MSLIIQRLPFFVELFYNGIFILIFSLLQLGKIPPVVDEKTVRAVVEVMSYGVPFVLLFVVMANYLLVESMEEFLRKYVFSLVVLIPLIITLGDVEFALWLASAHLLSSILSLYDTGGSGDSNYLFTMERVKSWSQFKLKPAQIVLLTFAGLILVGTFMLMLPFATKDGSTISAVDALFMATSATCVTGLSTLSLNGDFSLFGQIVILILIQIGGLGYMTLFSSMTILMGRSMAMKDRVIMQDLLDISSQEELVGMIFDIIKLTIIIELWGAIILTAAFSMEGFEFGRAIYYGFFHSISAFCNAGFALFDDSLESFAVSPLIHGTISILIILGGLGFIVLKELKSIVLGKHTIARMGLHTKVVLITTSILTATAFFAIFFGEFLNSLDGYSLWEKIQISMFQSVTLRTAGFNTIPLTNLHAHTLYLMSLFMFIGASPGSTGGGIKTSTLAILFQSIRSTLKGRRTVELFDRKIPNQVVVKVTALSIISVMFASFFIFLLLKIEKDQHFLTIFFEVISASGTVGLSLGITSLLSPVGKVAIIVLMFVGRIGPLTLVLAIGEKNRTMGNFEYPEGRVMIG